MGRKVAIFSNSPWSPTGYGTQTAQLAKRLQADGHEVGIIANWGLTGAPMEWEGMTVLPQGSHPYSLDTLNSYGKWFHGGERGLVIVLYDTWPLLEAGPELLNDREFDAWFWAPVDHAPLPPKVGAFCKDRNVIAMSEFGARMFADAGMPAKYMIWHGIDTATFRPVESDARKTLGVPEDAHLTIATMANIGQAPVRKSWAENLLAWRIFAEKHDDAYIYIHTQLRHPRGVDLASFISAWGLPADRVRIVDQGAYAAGMVQPEQIAALMSASDVMLMATAGEGFGLPAAEANACGTPVIGTDFSAQQEVVSGWLVPYHFMWDYMQGAAQAVPDINAIASALEQSYQQSDDERAEMSQRAREHAMRFDADTVYAEKWRPFMADREARPNREQRRRKNKK
jgi:glycosyltransferase involved in cell wall biosynthesis